MGKRRHTTRIALIAVAVLLLVTLGAHWSRVEEAWQAMLARGAQLRAQVDGRPAARAVLWGEPESGDAWVHYDRAIAAAARIDASDRWVEYHRELDSGDPARALELKTTLLADGAEPLAALRSGATRREAHRIIDWEAGFDVSPQNLLTTRGLVNTAVLSAVQRAEAGDGVGAARVMLDGMQLGGDLVRSPLLIDQMIGAALIAIASKEALFERGLIDSLSRAGLEQLRSGMELLDENLEAGGWDWYGELALFVHHVREQEGAGLWDSPLSGLSRWQAWRYLFSSKLTCADYVREMDSHLRQVAAASQLGWSARMAKLEQLQKEIQASPNPLTSVMAPNVSSATRTQAQTLALLRLARAAVALRLDGEVPALSDPFGTILQHAEKEGTVRIWSAGDGRTHANRLTVEVRQGAANAGSSPR